MDVDWQTLEFASEELRSDEDLVLAAAAQNARAFELVPDERRREELLEIYRGEKAKSDLCQDRALLLQAVRQDWRALGLASDGLMADAEVILEAVAQDPRARGLVPAGLLDRPFVLRAMAGNRRAFELLGLDADGLCRDRVLAKAAHSVVLYHIILCCIILYHNALHYSLVYYIILYYIMLCYIMLYYVMLYYIILW